MSRIKRIKKNWAVKYHFMTIFTYFNDSGLPVVREMMKKTNFEAIVAIYTLVTKNEEVLMLGCNIPF